MHLVSSDHVLGATGGIGTHVFDALRSNGHTVTTYVRNPTRVPASWGEHVNVIVGELSDTTAIEQAVAGADAVVSALGPSMDKKAAGLLLIEGTRNIIDAMHEHGVKRYVGNGTPSVLDPQESGTWQTKLPTFMAKTFLRRAYGELVGMSRIVMGPGLDWTIVRFLAPKDGPTKGNVRYGFYGTDKLHLTITRADISAFTAEQVEDLRHVGRAVGISN